MRALRCPPRSTILCYRPSRQDPAHRHQRRGLSFHPRKPPLLHRRDRLHPRVGGSDSETLDMEIFDWYAQQTGWHMVCVDSMAPPQKPDRPPAQIHCPVPGAFNTLLLRGFLGLSRFQPQPDGRRSKRLRLRSARQILWYRSQETTKPRRENPQPCKGLDLEDEPLVQSPFVLFQKHRFPGSSSQRRRYDLGPWQRLVGARVG